MDKSKEKQLTKKEQLKLVFKEVLKQVVKDARRYLNMESKIEERTNELLEEVSIRTKIA